MVSAFWTNTLWYLLLGVTVAVQVYYSIYRAENRKQAVAFYFTLAGMTLWLETLLLIFFKSYAYYPKIILDPVHWYDDILAGNLFSQFSVAASMLMVAVLRLKIRWYFVFALVYGGIETLFLELGIYEHNWYQTWYTIVLLPFAFLIARKMYDRLREGLRPLFYYAYVAFSLFALVVVTLWWALSIADIQAGNDRLFADQQISRYGVTVSLHLIISTLLLWVYFSGTKRRYKALAAAAAEMLYYAVYRLGWLVVRPGWFIPASAAVLMATYAAIVMIDRLYGLGTPALKLHCK